jgi:hypothetical protein
MAITKFRIVQVESGGTKTVDFGSRVINASTAVQGFDMSYSKDHHVRSIKVATSMNGFSESTVTVGATSEMRDDSNNVGKGEVTVLVIAECEA